jgi:transposase
MKIMTRRKISTEFKIESANLVLDQGYTISEACDAVGIGDTAMRRWVNQLRNERQGITPVGSKALTPDQQKIQELETRIKRIEMEKEILKKATALLMSDTMRSLY